MLRRISLCLALFSIVPNTAHAGIPQPSVSLGISTLGFGDEIGFHDPNSWFGVRLGVHAARIDLKQHYSSSHSDDVIKYQNESLLLDYYPWSARFRITAGVIVNQDRVFIQTVPKSFHRSTGNYTGTIRFNALSPYIGVGYTLPFGHSWALNADIGTMYQNAGRIGVHATGSIADAPQANSNTNRVTLDDLRNFRRLAFYPILSIELTYRF